MGRARFIAFLELLAAHILVLSARGHVKRQMWWIGYADETSEPPHVCSDACTKVVDSSWVCTHTGTILGPAMLAPIDAVSPVTPQSARTNSCAREWTARMRFRSAAQHVMSKLLGGERREGVEGARLERARTLARREAMRSVSDDVSAHRLPDLSRALSAALTKLERATAGVDACVTLSEDTEARILSSLVDFYARNIHRPSLMRNASESRMTHEGIALAILYLMREGIPGLLPMEPFVAANLPDLSRWGKYNLDVS